MSKSLWGDLAPETLDTPVRLLKEQGTVLTQMTRGVLVCEVSPRPGSDAYAFIHDLVIRVPSLNNYHITLVTIFQPLKIYPTRLLDRVLGRSQECPDYAAFSTALEKVLGGTEIKQAVASLLAQAKG